MADHIRSRCHTSTHSVPLHQYLEFMIQQFQDGVAIVDFHHTIRFANPAAEAIFGVEPDGLTGRSLPDWLTPESRQMYWLQAGRCRENHRCSFELTVINGTGAQRILAVSAVPLPGDSGEYAGTCVFFRDNTSAKASEEAMRIFKLVADHAKHGVGIVHPDYRFYYINEAFARMHGYNVEELIDRDLSLFHTEEQMADVARLSRQIVETGVFDAEEVWHVHRDGTPFPTLMTGHLLRDDSTGEPKYICATAIDLTEHHRMQETLHRTQRLESVGVLAGGLAHDFNNALAGILNNITLARLRLPKTALSGIRLQQAEESVFKAQRMTQQLLSLAKGGAPIRKPSKINSMVEENVQFAVSGSPVRCSVDLPMDLWTVDMDEGQMSQVIQNLVINAVQASPSGGVIEIIGENVELSENEVHGLASGDYVRITIQDHGCGIEPDHLPRVFDPYFTTKPEGSGLGLTTTYAIVSNHSGGIDIRSHRAAGTSVSIFLPRCIGAVEPDDWEQNRIYTGTGHVMVLEDDALVREALEELLKTLGYSVSSFSCGEALLEGFRANQRAGVVCDAVIVDLTIRGGLGGRSTMVELLELDPDIIAIVASGYSDDPVLANYADHGFKAMLTKPYRLETLSKTLKRLIG